MATVSETRGRWSSLLSWHVLLVKTATSLLYVMFIAIGLFQIISRYLLNQPITWAEQLSRYMFAWSIFLGAALVIATGSHISLDFLTSKMSARSQRILATAVSIGAICLISWLYVYDGFRLLPIVSKQFSPALGIRMTIPYLCLPVGGMLMVVSLLLVLVSRRNDTGSGDT